MKKECTHTTIDSMIYEEFSFLENSVFDSYSCGRRFEDLSIRLDFYLFEREEEDKEVIVQTDFLPVDHNDYVAFLRTLLEVINSAFETKHATLQRNGVDNMAICFVGDELGTRISFLCFSKLRTLFVNEQERYITLLPRDMKKENKILEGIEYMGECANQFRSAICIYPLKEEWENRLERYIKENFYHFEDYMKAADILLRFTVKAAKAIDKMKEKSLKNGLTLEFIQKVLPAKPDNYDFYEQIINRYKNEYMIVELENW